LPIDTDAEGVLRIDWAPLLEPLCDAGRAPEQRAGLFHDTLVAAAVEVTRRVAQDQRFDAVGLTGGVFQNRVLSERLAAALVGQGLTVRQHRIMPCNDGGLSFGQVVEWAAVEQSTKMLKGGCGHGG
jgi:hydrogenase maturation protein HypF